MTTAGKPRSGTVVSVTNQSKYTNKVSVTYYKGFGSAPEATTVFSIPPGMTCDFASRQLPTELTVANSVPNPELVFDEGRAIVSSVYPEIAVSARVYYTSGERDDQLLAITDSKVVVLGEGNHGD